LDLADALCRAVPIMAQHLAAVLRTTNQATLDIALSKLQYLHECGTFYKKWLRSKADTDPAARQPRITRRSTLAKNESDELSSVDSNDLTFDRMSDENATNTRDQHGIANQRGPGRDHNRMLSEQLVSDRGAGDFQNIAEPFDDGLSSCGSLADFEPLHPIGQPGKHGAVELEAITIALQSFQSFVQQADDLFDPVLCQFVDRVHQLVHLLATASPRVKVWMDGSLVQAMQLRQYVVLHDISRLRQDVVEAIAPFIGSRFVEHNQRLGYTESTPVWLCKGFKPGGLLLTASFDSPEEDITIHPAIRELCTILSLPWPSSLSPFDTNLQQLALACCRSNSLSSPNSPSTDARTVDVVIRVQQAVYAEDPASAFHVPHILRYTHSFHQAHVSMYSCAGL
jgi:hypothetical protein